MPNTSLLSNQAMGFEKIETMNDTSETKVSIGSQVVIKCGESPDEGIFLYKVGNIDITSNSTGTSMENLITLIKDSTGIQS